MSEPLARMERPAADSFSGHRKLFVVFLVYSHESAPAEYNQRCERYWQQADEQLLRLETRIGAARHVYHESVYETGDSGLSLIERLNQFSHRLVSRRCAEGAVLEALEEQELASELNDWERFMMLGFASRKVADLVSDLYSQASKKRNEHAVQVIDSTLGDDESGILFVREGHRLQFPQDIEVFSVVPPALDEMQRWLRDQARAVAGKGNEEAEEEVDDVAPSVEEQPS
ncbi:MAG: hypothetical protein JW846_00555 [Dehalococcoidia bacterium]|nr:hypothetical protein [Dehalococcoidia bacterium]